MRNCLIICWLVFVLHGLSLRAQAPLYKSYISDAMDYRTTLAVYNPDQTAQLHAWFWTHSQIQNLQGFGIQLQNTANPYSLFSRLQYIQLGDQIQYEVDLLGIRPIGQKTKLGLGAHTNVVQWREYGKRSGYAASVLAGHAFRNKHYFQTIFRIPVRPIDQRNTRPGFMLQYLHIVSDRVFLSAHINNSYTDRLVSRVSIWYQASELWNISLMQGITPVESTLAMEANHFSPWTIHLLVRYNPVLGFFPAISFSYVWS